MATFTKAVVDAESWGEYVTVARQISSSVLAHLLSLEFYNYNFYLKTKLPRASTGFTLHSSLGIPFDVAEVYGFLLDIKIKSKFNDLGEIPRQTIVTEGSSSQNKIKNFQNWL